MGNKDDPRFIEFVEALKELHAEQAEGADDVEHRTLEEYLAEAERRYWAAHGDPDTELARLLKEARRRLATRDGKEDER